VAIVLKRGDLFKIIDNAFRIFISERTSLKNRTSVFVLLRIPLLVINDCGLSKKLRHGKIKEAFLVLWFPVDPIKIIFLLKNLVLSNERAFNISKWKISLYVSNRKDINDFICALNIKFDYESQFGILIEIIWIWK